MTVATMFLEYEDGTTSVLPVQWDRCDCCNCDYGSSDSKGNGYLTSATCAYGVGGYNYSKCCKILLTITTVK